MRDLPALAPVTDLTGIVAAYVTPAHQHPLGRVLPAADRVALLDAARAAGAVVVEDDYDSEFRYDVAPVPALASLDRDRVAYLGTAAKSVAPSLRLGWMVPPPAHLDAVNARRADHPRGLAVAGAAGVPRPAARRVRRQGGAHRAPGVRRARAPGRGRAHAVRRAGGAARRDVLHLAAPPARRAAGARGGPRAGFEVNLLSDYCRSARLTGLVIGFGGVTDDELDRALAAVTSVL